MNAPPEQDLARKSCTPCEGGVPPLPPEEVADLLKKVDHWELVQQGQRIRRRWKAKSFMAGIEFFNKVAELAEQEGHHPDLHLEGYRYVIVDLSTHAVGGLTENDFIMAAKIDQIPIAVKR